MVEWATVVKAAQIVDGWCNGEKTPRGKWICKDGEKYIGIDNSDGNCWVEEFDTALECIKWLTDYEASQQSANITLKDEAAKKFMNAMCMAFRVEGREEK